MKNVLLFVLLCAIAVNSATAQVIGNHAFKQLDAEKIEKIKELRTENLRFPTFAGKMQTHPALRQSAVVKHSMDSFIVPEIFKQTFEYDSRGNNTSEMLYDWSFFLRDWELLSKVEFVRNNDGVLTEAVSYVWDSFDEVWEYYDKIEYLYNESGNLAMVILYEWNDRRNVWQLSGRAIYDYDDNGVLISITVYAWNDLTNEWMVDNRNVLTYDENGVLTMMTNYIWSDVGNNWTASVRFTHTYDNNENLASTIISIFMGAWMNFLKEEFVFDTSYSVADLITPVSFDYSFVNKLTEIKAFEWTGISWQLLFTGAIHWSEKEIETSISVVESDDFSLAVFPNPAISELHIKSDFPKTTHYTIFNTSGQIVMQGYLSENATINVASMASGIYFLNISGQTAQFVKQ